MSQSPTHREPEYSVNCSLCRVTSRVSRPGVTSQFRKLHAGASFPLETIMHSPLCFRFPPLFSKNVLTLRKILTIFPFPEIFLDFHPPKFLMTFFSHRPQISNSPIFAVSVHFPPVSRKFSPT